MFLGSIQLSTGRSTSAGSSSTATGISSTTSASVKESMTISTDNGQRQWRVMVSPPEAETNALLIQYVDDTGEWATAQVFLARS